MVGTRWGRARTRGTWRPRESSAFLSARLRAGRAATCRAGWRHHRKDSQKKPGRDGMVVEAMKYGGGKLKARVFRFRLIARIWKITQKVNV